MKLNNLLYQQHYDRKKLFMVFLILIAALTIDVAISDLAPAATVRGIVTFTIIAGVFVLGQFVILSMIKAKNNENESKFYRQLVFGLFLGSLCKMLPLSCRVS